ncbi:MAG: extracellular solute-binding protein [Pseudomonadota bacterium]|nr:extracellular solute-binding protein [Pseudomonadota bacterium]
MARAKETTIDCSARRVVVASLLGIALCGRGVAQNAGRGLAARELALYQGADRHERLVEAAKKEGELSVYHVYPNLPNVMAAFTKKYGIKVKAWRAGSEAVLQRLMAESRGGRHEVDVVQNNAPENEAAYREKLLQEVWSPGLKDLVPAATPAHRSWAGITLDIWTAAYNTALVKRDDLPRRYQDLLDPKWRGRIAIEANNHGWFGALLAELGEEPGTKLFSSIVAGNGISTRKGHSVLANLVASGEIPLALTVYSWIPEQLKKKGAPIEALAIPPLIGQASTIAVLRRAPNPASALLFHDFMLGEGQQLLADATFIPASRLFDHPYARTPIKMIDPAHALDRQEQWLKSFDELIVKKAK